MIDDISVVDREALLVTKLAGLLDRPQSRPGMKDREDIVGLLRDPGAPVDWERVVDILGRAADGARRRQLGRDALALVLDAPIGSDDERRAVRRTLSGGIAALDRADRAGSPETTAPTAEQAPMADHVAEQDRRRRATQSARPRRERGPRLR